MPEDLQQLFITVSVVMCTYNGAAFVEEQLLSVLEQTYPPKEILIFDDASTDDTVTILEAMEEKYPVISLRKNPVNIGFTRNFEQAMLAATGDAIAICDQDDVWIRDKIEKMVRSWKPECPLIYCFSYMFQQQLPENPEPNPIVNKFQGTDARKLSMYNTVSGHAIIFRKKLLPLVLPFSETTTYDWWMAVVAACNGGVQYYPEALVCQRLHSNNVTLDEHRFTKDYIRKRQKQEVIDNNRLFATTPNLPEPYKKFYLTLANLAEKSLLHPFYKPLFYFLVRYRRIIFYHKKRKVGFFSHVKHSYRRTITK